ncbi:MAG: hypothetical protein ACPLTR_03310, partial [Thermacetogeniaceae bacterium]
FQVAILRCRRHPELLQNRLNVEKKAKVEIQKCYIIDYRYDSLWKKYSLQILPAYKRPQMPRT